MSAGPSVEVGPAVNQVTGAKAVYLAIFNPDGSGTAGIISSRIAKEIAAGLMREANAIEPPQ